MVVTIYQILVDALIFVGFIKNWYFDKNSYSLGMQTNQNFEIMALIGQYSAGLQVLQALVLRFTLVASFTLVI